MQADHGSSRSASVPHPIALRGAGGRALALTALSALALAGCGRYAEGPRVERATPEQQRARTVATGAAMPDASLAAAIAERADTPPDTARDDAPGPRLAPDPWGLREEASSVRAPDTEDLEAWASASASALERLLAEHGAEAGVAGVALGEVGSGGMGSGSTARPRFSSPAPGRGGASPSYAAPSGVTERVRARLAGVTDDGPGVLAEEDVGEDVVELWTPIAAASEPSDERGAWSSSSAPRAPIISPEALDRVDVEASPASGLRTITSAGVGELVGEVASRVRSEATASAEPLRAFMRLAALESIAPGAVETVAALDGHGDLSGESGWAEVLTPEEIATLKAARALITGFLSGEAGSAGDAADAIALLDEAKRTLRKESGSLRIATAALCRRVAGYGLYEPFETTTFLAGAPRRVIVYTEADRFAHRAASEAERASVGLTRGGEEADFWAVELGVELALYHESDGVLAWRRPRETIVDISRRQRRDFYLVADIELPPTLTVGGYQLKVTLVDETTGAEDAALIPIDIVADRSALAYGR